MAAPFTIDQVGVEGAAELSRFSSVAYVAALGDDFDDPVDLRAHLETSLSVDAWRRYLAQDRVFVAKVRGAMAGFLQIGPAERSADLDIRRLYVDPARLSEGIGTALMQHVLADPTVRSVPVVWLDVWQDNERAQRFYRRLGFELTGERRPFVLSSGEVDGYDLVMVRRRAP